MDSDVQQLVEMGATVAQARAALKKHKDVMQAAERIFDGQFDDVMSEDDAPGKSVDVSGAPDATRRQAVRMATPDEDTDMEGDQDENGNDDEDDDGADYIDYDSDYDAKAEAGRTPQNNVDPYAGIFFSKDRREEVIEVEEDMETITIPGRSDRVKVMSQGQWMKGCPEGGEQGFLFGLYSQLSEGACPCPHECGDSTPRYKSDFFMVFLSFSTYIAHLRKLVRKKCKTCTKEFCFACGEPITGEKVQRPTAATVDDPLFHCPDLQGVILGVGLSMLELLYAEQAKAEPTPDGEEKDKNTKKRKAETPSTPTPTFMHDLEDDDDMYYAVKGKKAKGGIGYAGNVKEDTRGQTEALAVQRAKDEKVANLLSSIRVYLPCVERPGGGQTSDFLVHPTTLAHLRRRFNYISSSLLRNDSLTDMCDRSILYFELFEWLETISNHEALASMMAMPIMVPSSVKNITSKKTADGRQYREKTVVYEGSSGPRELLEALVIQAQAAVKGLEGMKSVEAEPEEMTEEQKRMTVDLKGKGKEKDTTSDENAKLLQFCQRILATAYAIDRSLRETKGDAFVDRLHASLPKVHSTSFEANAAREEPLHVGESEEATQKIYMKWASKVRFEYCDLTVPAVEPIIKPKSEDETPNYKFYFNNEARMLANADIPKRSLAIAKELAVLTTNLPVAWDSSIFLRVDESRVDIIKALITGPEGTPYYNGCYLFDIFLGPSYNSTPPSVKYMTTNGGKFRFNPNLYADGKVCLSLLGTWSGPSWVSGKSTLLQVLISIQSMILCEEPYLNEPGWANDGGSPQSQAYSANVRRMVVNTAMLGNLKNPPEPFADVIRTHFRLKARSITKQLDQWLAMDDGKSTSSDGGGYPGSKAADGQASTNGLQRDVDEMKRILKKLEDGEGVSGPSSSKTKQ
ncbi:hypothetical protein BD410DRAFT_779533 [Rickenella mellea]|uniref:UBC core domain-containing protein n=1 Tax=Rickenella mellea TaxID=50990 RepID=A0A4R5XDR3_9AGAM|nr:hypothetical protein BD410DRAFT_779533 [Rickenella mellea]